MSLKVTIEGDSPEELADFLALVAQHTELADPFDDGDEDDDDADEDDES